MIRRGFWLTAGVVTGVYGYRRVSTLGRQLSGRLNLSGLSGLSGLSAPARSRSRRGAVAVASQTYRFTRDVREGMELYRLAHSAPAGSTLSTDRARGANRENHQNREPEDGH